MPDVLRWFLLGLVLCNLAFVQLTGAVSVACLADHGHDVVGVDVNPAKVDAIGAGKSPIVEVGLEDLLRGGVESGRIRATSDSAEAVREIAGEKRPLDVVYDGVGKSVFQASLGLIRMRGTMATFGNASGPVDPISPLELSANGSLFLTRPTLFHHITSQAEIQARADDLYGWIDAGQLQIRIGARFALADAADAHRALEGRQTTGKVILVP